MFFKKKFGPSHDLSENENFYTLIDLSLPYIFGKKIPIKHRVNSYCVKLCMVWFYVVVIPCLPGFLVKSC